MPKCGMPIYHRKFLREKQTWKKLILEAHEDSLAVISRTW